MTSQIGSLTPNFDWYQATVVDQDVRPFAESFLGVSGAVEIEWSNHGLHGYKKSAILRDQRKDRVAAILHCGNSGSINIQYSGSRAIDGSAAIRRLYPVHRVTRMDSAIDLADLGSTVEDLVSEVVNPALDAIGSTSKSRFISPDRRREVNASAGTTYYLGSSTSAVMTRIYDKAAEQKVEGDWIRLEAQVRPQKAAKSEAAKISAADVWGGSATLRAVVDAFLAYRLAHG